MSWMEILQAEVKKANDAKGRGGKAKVATMLGVSRTAVSLLVDGKYVGKIANSTQRMAARVLAVFGQGHVHCPHLNAEIAVPKCADWRKKPMPRSNPADIRHWLACRECPVGKALAEGRTPDSANALDTAPSKETVHAR